MGNYYTKTVTYPQGSDRVYVLEPREAFHTPFDIGSDWTEARLGIMLSATDTAGFNNAFVSGESMPGTTPTESIQFGIKDPSAALPKAAGSIYWGIDHNGAVTVPGGDHVDGMFRTGAWDGATVAGAVSGQSQYLWIKPGAAQNNNSAFGGFMALKFQIANRGQANQTVTVSLGRNSNMHTDTRIPYLRGMISAISYNVTSGAVPWNTGSAAKPIPSTIYFRMPFVQNRWRVHSVAMELIA